MSSLAPPLSQRLVGLYASITDKIDSLQLAAALVLRIYVARVFFFSGLTKIRDWNVTLALFQNEYHVPVLSPAAAAILGTAAELGLPVLLLLGLGSRFTAAAMFIFNIVAATSYPDLSPAGLKDHILWGALLLVTVFYGPGKLSLDHWLATRYGSAR